MTQDAAEDAIQGLTRVTVNLKPAAATALDQAAVKTGECRTDVINQAILAYDQLLRACVDHGSSTLRVQTPDNIFHRFDL